MYHPVVFRKHLQQVSNRNIDWQQIAIKEISSGSHLSFRIARNELQDTNEEHITKNIKHF